VAEVAVEVGVVAEEKAVIVVHRLPGRPLEGRVAFAIDDAEDAARRLRARGVECLGPLDVGWGKLVFCRDPDGNLIELVRMGRS